MIQPVTNNLSLTYPQTHGIYVHASAIANAPVASAAISVVAHAPVHVAPVISHSPAIHAIPSPLLRPSSTPAPIISGSNLENESIIVEKPDFRVTANYTRLFQVNNGCIQKRNRSLSAQ